MYKATCHCGNVELLVPALPTRLIQCNCSICRRYGALWGHYTRATVTVNYRPESVSAYRWGDQVIEFCHCSECGCVTHYEGVEKTPEERLSINFRMFPSELYSGLPVRLFDGADSWKFID